MISIKEILTNRKFFAAIDTRLADLIARICPEADDSALLAAALANKELRSGHVCLDLTSVKSLLENALTELNIEKEELPSIPDIENWSKLLTDKNIADAVSEAGENRHTPLTFDKENRRLYLSRYWNYEQQVAQNLQNRINSKDFHVEADAIKKLFPDIEEEGTARQCLAAYTAGIKSFSVITGGPGTGKTYTAARIITLLLMSDKELTIKLTAPTGKAAIRLLESIRSVREDLVVEDEILKKIPDTVSTIDRLLGFLPDSPYYRYNTENPLPADAVIIDEASMIDLPKMAKLISALRPDARLILLGDMNQLSSVESGCVLSDICSAAEVNVFSKNLRQNLSQSGIDITDPDLSWNEGQKINDAIVELSFSRRFAEEGSVAALSNAVKEADNEEKAAAAFQLLQSDNAVSHHNITMDFPDQSFRSLIIENFQAYLAAETPEDAFRELDNFRVLCAVRKGPFGVEFVNKLIESILVRSQNHLDLSQRFYHKRIIMITRNEYSLNLFNGDIGIVITEETESGPGTSVCFKNTDREGRSSIRKISPNMLPEHETAFAMTIHKSQGSEFERTAIILPPKESRVLTRELIYTGLTRTRTSAHIWCTEKIFKRAIMQKTERSSGLAGILQQIQADD
ncbi:MAG: exodeoxyribonuclease V subunit alpha [Planctomycetota bacterium]|jgi:exodeoxyribonuclease V alpha subunit